VFLPIVLRITPVTVVKTSNTAVIVRRTQLTRSPTLVYGIYQYQLLLLLVCTRKGGVVALRQYK